MKKIIAITGLAALAVVGLTGCTENRMNTAIERVENLYPGKVTEKVVKDIDRFGKKACQELHKGELLETIATQMAMPLIFSGADPHFTGVLIGAGVYVHCPEFIA